MNLKQLIEYLGKKDRDIIVPVGFDKPRLCIGDYTCLAFEPAGDVTVGAMLQCARSAVGTTYRNWLDDEYQMHGGTEVYLAMSGCVGEKIGGVLLDYMTGVYYDEEIKNRRSVINKSTYEIAGLIAERDHVRTDLAFADDTIHVLTVERDTIGADLVTADRIIHKLKAELCSVESDRDIMFQNYRNTIAKLQEDIRGLEVEFSAHKEDSEVFKKVVDAITMWNRSPIEPRRTIADIRIVVNDYLDALEGPPEAKTTIFEVEHTVDVSRTIHLQKMRIDEQKQTIENLKDDSAVLMKVVNAIKDWDDSTGRAFPTLYKIVDLLVDYTDVPEGDYDDGNIQKK